MKNDKLNAKPTHPGEELLNIAEEPNEDQAQVISTIAHEVGVEGVLQVLEALLSYTATSLQPTVEQSALENITVLLADTRMTISEIVRGERPYGYSVKGWRDDDTIPGSPPEPTPSEDWVDIWLND
jgi:hypothetical protein